MTETRQFKTELKQLLHLIIHSLYSHKDIFLRELISNASDAIDTVRFQSLTNGEVLEGNGEWKIKIIPNEANGTLTIADNGVGMSMETAVENLGTIARSGTRAFLDALQKADTQERPGLIGQFGVGFYASFMVADKVTVESRMAGPTSAGVRWESDGQGDFTVASCDKPTRGTEVTLHLRKEDLEFLQPFRIRQIVKQYSDFIEHPIVMDVEKEEDKEKKLVEETLNSRKAIWLRQRSAITEEEYHEFYKHISHDYTNPAKIIHYNAEGNIEFKSILFLPAQRPHDLFWDRTKHGLQLYIQRVFIMDDCEALLPPYLRFVRGVVDSPDLPLNVSRELLQQSAPLEKIKNNLTSKILSTLDEMKRKEYDTYVKWYDELGVVLKEGISQDWGNREKLADLLLFASTKTEPGKYTTLAQYVENMPVSQNEIWYLTGESRALIEHAPVLESFKAQGQEVLLLTEPIDEFLVNHLYEYKGKQLKAADRGATEAEIDAGKKTEFADLLTYMKEQLSEVKDVRLSGRLKESAAVLVADEGDMGANMERLMQRMGKQKDLPASQRILEINPEHAAVAAIRSVFERGKDDPRLPKYCRLLYDQALLAEGSKVPDPVSFAQRINELLTRDAAK